MRFSFLCTQLTALIEPNWCFLLYCCACLHPNTISMVAGWTTVPCPTTNLSILTYKSSARTKQSVISVALKTPLEIILGICIYKSSLLYRLNDYIGLTPSCPTHILHKIAPMIVSIPICLIWHFKCNHLFVMLDSLTQEYLVMRVIPFCLIYDNTLGIGGDKFQAEMQFEDVVAPEELVDTNTANSGSLFLWSNTLISFGKLSAISSLAD